jgi:3'-5' exoribonuclease
MNGFTISERAITVGGWDLLTDLCVKYPQFETWSAASKPHQHHYGDGGLIQHTAEVIELCFDTRKTLKLEKIIDGTELFYAALFHDVGKIYDYEKVEEMGGVITHWQKTEHARKIHHISRSVIIWNELISTNEHKGIKEKYADSVTHAILSHHGRREWGSPVAPKSRTAWLLHLCDGISARMNDADTLDRIN